MERRLTNDLYLYKIFKFMLALLLLKLHLIYSLTKVQHYMFSAAKVKYAALPPKMSDIKSSTIKTSWLDSGYASKILTVRRYKYI